MILVSRHNASGCQRSGTWDCDRRFLLVDPVVRRDVFHVLDGEILCGAGARWLGHRLDHLGRVQAFFDVGFGKGVLGRPGGGASAPSAPSTSTKPTSKKA